MYFRNSIIDILLEQILVYLRKSRSDDPYLEVHEVLAKHEQDLQEMAVRMFGKEIPQAQIFREIASSETIDSRPEMIKLLRAIENPNIKAIMCIEPQRLSRGDLEDNGRLIKLLRFTNTKVITPTMVYDLSNEYDRDAFERELKRGNEYLEYTKKILKRGRESAVRSGQYLACRPSYGYKKVEYKDGRKKIKTLEIVPHEAEIVKMIFNLCTEKEYSFDKIANTLNDMKVKPYKNDFWHRSSVQRILENHTYIGKVRWNYYKTEKFIENQELLAKRVRNTEKEAIIVDGLHKAIIDEETFYKAQSVIANRPPCSVDSTMKNPFATIMKCSKCGKTMKYKVDANGERRIACPSHKRCNTGTASFEEVANAIYKALEDNIEDFELKISNNNQDEVIQHQKQIEILENNLKKLESLELSQWEKYSAKEMPKHIFERLNEKVLREKEEVLETLSTYRSNSPAPIDYQEKIYSFRHALELLKDDTIDARIKNKYLKQIISRIEYTRPPSECLTVERAKELGIERKKMKWYSHPFSLEIFFLD
jgi:hypothetical protein